MASTTPLLQLVNVSKRYDSVQSAEQLCVLHDVSLEIAAGESAAVVGPSGSGKSTLLNIIGTLDRPSSGTVMLGGQDLNQLTDDQLAAIRNRQIGFIFQAHHLLPHCTVLENVLVPTLAHATSGSRQRAAAHSSNSKPETRNPKPSESLEPEARATKLLERVGLGERLHHRPGQLSGGERQRVAVVRALINQPQLLLADEPTGALDHASATALGQLLIELNREEGVTLIVVTHSLDLARQMGRVVELFEGTLKPMTEEE